MSGIFRPGQCVQRVTRNAGNRRFIRGGLIRHVAPSPAPAAPPAEPEGFIDRSVLMLRSFWSRK